MTKPDESGLPTESRRARAALAGVVLCCLLVAGVAVTGTGNAAHGVKFSQSGHWIYNSAVGKLFHLDGGTKNVDQEIDYPDGDPNGARVVQTDKSGYVLSEGKVTEFGKSDLVVADPLEVPQNELPLGLESAGAAFAVYQQAGRIARFGDVPVIEFAGSRLGDPVVTPTGTLWVHRLDKGDLCQLPLSAKRMSCAADLPKGHKGGLTVIGEQAVFVDTTAKQLYAVSAGGVQEKADLGNLDVPDTALIASNDVDGKVAIVDPAKGVVHLVDPSGLSGRKAVEPTTRSIPPGKYERVASTGKSLAMIDEKRSKLITVAADGKQAEQQIPGDDKGQPTKRRPQLIRGDDQRVYVDSIRGDRVMVVDRDGGVDSLVVERQEDKPDPKITPTPSKPTHTPKPIHTPKPTITPSDRDETTPPPIRTLGPVRPDKNDRPTTNRPSKSIDKTTDRPTQKPTTQRPTTQKPVKPVAPPPRVPGAAKNVVATRANGYARLTWQAAPANRAAITKYLLSWSGGAKTVGGTARSATIPGLSPNVSYAITIRAVNRIGIGPAVKSNPVRLKPIPRIVASRGASTSYGDNCQPPECAFIKFRGENLRPNTAYTFQPVASEWGTFNEGATLTTDDQGNILVEDRFPCSAVGQTVHIYAITTDGVLEDIESNKFVWKADDGPG